MATRCRSSCTSISSKRGIRGRRLYITHAVTLEKIWPSAELVGKFACYMWEGYRRHTGPELHTGGMRGSNGKFQKNQI